MVLVINGVTIIWTLEAKGVRATYCVSPLARTKTELQTAVLGRYCRRQRRLKASLSCLVIRFTFKINTVVQALGDTWTLEAKAVRATHIVSLRLPLLTERQAVVLGE